jgi:hypothetical protein
LFHSGHRVRIVGVNGESLAEGVHRILCATLPFEDVGLAETLANDLVDALGLLGRDCLPRLDGQPTVPLELGEVGLGLLNRPELLLGLKRLQGSLVLTESVVGDAQLEVREIRDDLHPVRPHPCARVTLPRKGLVEFLDRTWPVLRGDCRLGPCIVLVPKVGQGGRRVRDDQHGQHHRARGSLYHLDDTFLLSHSPFLVCCYPSQVTMYDLRRVYQESPGRPPSLPGL